MKVQDALKVALVFVNGFAGLLSAYPGPELPVLVRLVCAALVAGCGGALLLLNPPGRANPARQAAPPTLKEITDELERRRAARGRDGA